MSDVLLHITAQAEWEKAQAAGRYEAPSLESEGFIHLSTPMQVESTANRFFRGHKGLIILVLYTKKLIAPLRYETVLDHGTFPHLFGPLNLDAIIDVVPITPRPGDGLFDLTGLLEYA